jgi:hypothetical protein
MTDLRMRFWIILYRLFSKAENFCLKMAIRTKLSPKKHTP